MNKAAIEFIEENINDFETIKVGYIKNIKKDKLIAYENIYKENINTSFVLTYWCSDCVFNMMKDIFNKFEKIKDSFVNQILADVPRTTNLVESNVLISEPQKKRRGRPRKINTKIK